MAPSIFGASFVLHVCVAALSPSARIDTGHVTRAALGVFATLTRPTPRTPLA